MTRTLDQARSAKRPAAAPTRSSPRKPTVGAVMRHEVVTVGPEESIEIAATRMRDQGISCLPVVAGGHLKGIVTSRDLVFRGLAGAIDRSQLRVGDVMSANALTCRADAPIEMAHRLMLDHGVTRLPVLDRDGRLVGLVTWGDIAELPKKPPRRKAVFYRRVTDSTGHPHDVTVGEVHLSSGVQGESLRSKAEEQFATDRQVDRWDRLADGVELLEDDT